MGYSATAQLEQLFDVGPAERAARRITERAGEQLTKDVRRLTPVSEVPGGAERGEWLEARGGRVPGTLKESWRTSAVDRTGPETFQVESYTEDAIAPHVEWDTAPHLIRAKRARVLRFWDAVGLVFRDSVHHPGTSGAHMMRDALALLDVSWRREAEEELLRWAREQEQPI